MSRSRHKSLSAGSEFGRVALFRIASVCSTLLHAGMALIFGLEYYHFRINEAAMVDTVQKSGFSPESFKACMNASRFMSGLSLLSLLLDFFASHACLWLSRRMKRENGILKHFYIFVQYLTHCASICLLLVLKPNTPSEIDATGSGFISTLPFLIIAYLCYAMAPHALVPFILGHELYNCFSVVRRMWYLDPRPIETVFTHSSYLTKDFVDQVEKACNLLGIKTKDIYVVDDDSRDIVVGQSMLEGMIRIPVRAITFFQEGALLAQVLGRLFDLHNLSLLKAKLCMTLIRLSIILVYILLTYLMYLRPSHDIRLWILGAQKITCILHFPGVVLLNCFLRHLERLSDEFVSRQGLRDNIARLFSKMGQNEEKVYNPYYTGIVGILSPTASFITRLERISTLHER